MFRPLAGGVNLPCHLVIVKGTEFFDAKQCRYVDMPVTDVLQMMGRAGRPQFDATGTACIFVHEPKKTFYKKFLHEPFPVESSLHLQLHDHLNAEIAGGSLHNVRDCIEYLSWTYYFRRLMMNPAYYGLVAAGGAEITAQVVERHLVALIALVASELCQAGCIELDGGAADRVSAAAAIANNTSFACTYLGRIAALYYLSYRTACLLRTSLLAIDALDFSASSGRTSQTSRRHPGRLQLWQLLMALCDAPEFSELPVRHNEELLNEQLAKEMTLAQGDVTSDPESLHGFLAAHSAFESPHCKAFLLLAAHMEGAALPISDYVTDTKTVLDQVTRVLKAMIDVAAEEQLLDIVLRLLCLSQLLVQGATMETSELSQLPGMGGGQVPQVFRQRGVITLRQLLRLGSEQLRQVAATAVKERAEPGDPASKRRGGRKATAKGGDEYENSKKIALLLQVCTGLPDLAITGVTVHGGSGEEGEAGEAQVGQELWSYNSDGPATPCTLQAGATYRITVRTSLGAAYNGPSVVHSNKPHKPKQASWYLLAALVPSTSPPSKPIPACSTKLDNVHYSEVMREGGFNTRGDLLALKQVGSISRTRTSQQITVQLPAAEDLEAAGGPSQQALALTLTCDAVRGLDCTVVVPVSVLKA
jgi:hypothetical protein